MTIPSEVSADLFRAIAEYTYDWESWVDARGVTRWINTAVQRITGYSVEECLARADYPLSLVHEPDRARLAEVLADAARGGSGNDVEFRIVPRQGGTRWVAISWQTVRSSQHQALGYRTSVRDIDQRKRAEQELQATRKRAEALAQARTELLANVSHELRSPAHCIAGFAELLLAEPLAKPQQRYVELIADQCQGMLRQVEDLLSLSALEAGGMELSREPLDLPALADALIEGGAQDARQRGLTLTAHSELSQRWVLGDALRIKQILRNLVDNALKFTERGGVTLRLREQGGQEPRWLLLEVEDTGQGMAPDQIETLLLPFRQGDASSSRRRGGVGLGLAIVERLVRAMGGELSIDSRPGAGTRVCVRLPCLPANPPSEEELAPHAPRRAGHALVVDDSPPARELLGEMLRLCGFSSVEVGSAAAALEALQRQRFDVVFLDYQMPDSDGAQLALALRRALAARAAPRVPIYLLTANVFANEQLRAAASQPGVEQPLAAPAPIVDGVLLKPLSRRGLSDVLAGLHTTAPVPQHQPAADCALLDESLVRELNETRARDGQTLLAKLLPRVERDVRDVLVAARERLLVADFAELRRLCHAAAGHAAIVGALRARELARGLEDALDGEQIPSSAELAGWLTAYERAFELALAGVPRLATP